MKEDERFDAVVSNPPYISTEDMAKLRPQVKQYVTCKNVVQIMFFFHRVSSRKVRSRLFCDLWPRPLSPKRIFLLRQTFF